MIKVLIVEDDPMVAQLNHLYVESVEGFTPSGIARNTEEAIEILKNYSIDLLLLDVYMPGVNGIEFLKQLREQNQDVDVILITAASGIDQIQQSLRLGAVDYLVKPFEFDRFSEALYQYRHHLTQLGTKENVNQQDIDKLLNPHSVVKEETKIEELPKGLTKNTLHHIHETILSLHENIFSTEKISEVANISRVSVRKYLKFLSEINYLEETLVYGVGRPIYQYRLLDKNKRNIDPYL